jgi:hypothetical protein
MNFFKAFNEFLKTSYEVPTITFKMSYKFLTHFLQISHKPRHMNFTYKFTMKNVRTYELLKTFLTHFLMKDSKL